MHTQTCMSNSLQTLSTRHCIRTALTGDMKGRYACSLIHELRVIFRLYDDIIHLLDIGSHDEVY